MSQNEVLKKRNSKASTLQQENRQGKDGRKESKENSDTANRVTVESFML